MAFPPVAGVSVTATTRIFALVPAVTAGPATLVAVTVRVPTVLSVMSKLAVPATSAAFEGSVAAPSDEVI